MEMSLCGITEKTFTRQTATASFPKKLFHFVKTATASFDLPHQCEAAGGKQ